MADMVAAATSFCPAEAPKAHTRLLSSIALCHAVLPRAATEQSKRSLIVSEQKEQTHAHTHAHKRTNAQMQTIAHHILIVLQACVSPPSFAKRKQTFQSKWVISFKLSPVNYYCTSAVHPHICRCHCSFLGIYGSSIFVGYMESAHVGG